MCDMVLVKCIYCSTCRYNNHQSRGESGETPHWKHSVIKNIYYLLIKQRFLSQNDLWQHISRHRTLRSRVAVGPPAPGWPIVDSVPYSTPTRLSYPATASKMICDTWLFAYDWGQRSRGRSHDSSTKETLRRKRKASVLQQMFVL